MESNSSPTHNRSSQWTRRDLMRVGVGAAAAATLGRVRPTSGSLLGSDLRIASIGVGNRGRADLDIVSTAPGAKIVALCDVDSEFLKDAQAAHPQKPLIHKRRHSAIIVVYSTSWPTRSMRW
jgi:hypothetical protein